MTTSDTVAELTPAQQRFVEARAIGHSVPAAGEAAGVSVRTSRRWAKDPAIQRELKRLQGENVEEVLRAMSALAKRAVGVLGRSMGQDAPANIQLRAAVALLQQLVALSQYADIETRLAALEEAAQTRIGG